MFLGRSEAAIRSLSLVAAAVAVPATMYLARRLFDEPVAIIAGAVLATNRFRGSSFPDSRLTWRPTKDLRAAARACGTRAPPLTRLHSHRRTAGSVSTITQLAMVGSDLRTLLLRPADAWNRSGTSFPPNFPRCLERPLLKHSRLWLISYGGGDVGVSSEPMLELHQGWLPAHYIPVEQRAFGDVNLTLLRRR